MEPDFDLFVSYRWSDATRVDELVAALQAQGLRVWRDKAQVEDFASITKAVSAGLARSKALLAFYSKAYPLSRACQFELTAAFLAGEALGGKSRVLVLNPERGSVHIEPVQVRDRLFAAAALEGDQARAGCRRRTHRGPRRRADGTVGR